MQIYESIRQSGPLFSVHSGDNIDADGPRICAGSTPKWRDDHEVTDSGRTRRTF
jgi:phosphodiesterase/alkaline phosphatase D-like protein